MMGEQEYDGNGEAVLECADEGNAEQPVKEPASDESRSSLDASNEVAQQQQASDELKGEFWGQLGPLLPPEGCEQVTPDGGVLKKVLQPGLGELPQRYARCLVHYVGRLQSTGAIFIDSKTESQTQQPVRVVAGRHTSPKETGLFMAVATMRMGERAAVYVQDPKYGYGEQGSFSFPAVPPSACLTYEVECVDFEDCEDPEQEGESHNLLYEERLERAEARRLLGNKLFAEGRYREAMGKYAVALSYLDEDFMVQLEGFYEDKANEVKLPIHLNMAACQLKIKDYHTAIYNCTEVLKLQPSHPKALFRRGTARHALGQTEGALQDLTAAAEQAPDDKAVRAELAAVKQTMKQERAAEAKLFKGQFKFPDPKPAQGDKDSSEMQTKPNNSSSDNRPGGHRASSVKSGSSKASKKKSETEDLDPAVAEARRKAYPVGKPKPAATVAQAGLLAVLLSWVTWFFGLIGFATRRRVKASSS